MRRRTKDLNLQRQYEKVQKSRKTYLPAAGVDAMGTDAPHVCRCVVAERIYDAILRFFTFEAFLLSVTHIVICKIDLIE